MDNLFLVLLLLSFAGLVARLARPQLVKMTSRKSAAGLFGTAAIAFFVLFGVTSSTPQSDAVSTTPAPASSTTTPQALNDSGYVINFNGVIVPDMSAVGTSLSAFGKDWQAYDYSAAISDLQNLRVALETAQSDLRSADSAFEPLSPSVERIRTLMDAAVVAGLKGVSTSTISDLKNGNVNGVENALAPNTSSMLNDFAAAKAAVAGWETKHSVDAATTSQGSPSP